MKIFEFFAPVMALLNFLNIPIFPKGEEPVTLGEPLMIDPTWRDNFLF
jgi:hypothetical protein